MNHDNPVKRASHGAEGVQLIANDTSDTTTIQVVMDDGELLLQGDSLVSREREWTVCQTVLN